MGKKPRATSTKHLLPFGELSPNQFERLCLWLVEREGYLGAEHYGDGGNEQGRDVIAYKAGASADPGLETPDSLFYFQCKRYKQIGPKTLIAEVDKTSALGRSDPNLKPVGIVFVTNAVVSAATRDTVRKHCRQQGLSCEFWAHSELDQRVKRHPDLLDEFFGTGAKPGCRQEVKATASRSVAIGGSVTGSQVVTGDANVIETHIHIHETSQREADQCEMRTPPWNVPYRRNPLFTGREQILKDLHDVLAGNSTAALTQVQAIAGLGGIGKTQTAVEYAYRYKDEYKAVFWVRADSEPSIISGMLEIAGQLDLPEIDAKESQQAVRAVIRWVSNNGGWLMIFDNADEPDQLKPYVPTDPKGHVLITSRAQSFHPLHIVQPVSLGVFQPEAALDFLLRRTNRQRCQDDEKQAASDLGRELGYLPLALEQAAAFISENSSRFQDYLAAYRKQRLELLNKSKPIAGDYEASIATTWSMNFSQVEQASPASADLLRFSAFLDPDNIPLILIIRARDQLGPNLSQALTGVEEEPLNLDTLVQPLTRYSLIRRDMDSQSYSIHRMVQEVMKARMNEGERRSWSERTVRALDACFPFVEHSNWWLCEALLPHAAAAARLAETMGFEFPEAARLMHQLGFFYEQTGRYEESERLYNSGLRIKEAVLGPNHPKIAETANNLAELYRKLGRYKVAEPLYKRALIITERALGPDDLVVAVVLNNLALLFEDQGRYDEEDLLLKRALKIREKRLPTDHPDRATSLNNLSLLYKIRGMYDDAQVLCKQALASRVKSLGPNHPDVAKSLNNLAMLSMLKPEYNTAEPLLRRALEITENALGPCHPDTATSLNNLGGLLHEKGNQREAIGLYQRALDIREKALGPDHPDVARTLNNLAGARAQLGELSEAEPLLLRARAIWGGLGVRVPDEAITLNGLAGLYVAKGRHHGAKALYRRALAIFEKSLGPDHPSAIRCRENMKQLDHTTQPDRK